MTDIEATREKRLERALWAAKFDLEEIVRSTPETPGPNGRVRKARARHALRKVNAALQDSKLDEAGTVPMVLPRMSDEWMLL